MPRIESRLQFVEHIETRGIAFFEVACWYDLEGIVTKWRHGTYQIDGLQTSCEPGLLAD